ncbi:hypothetical protein HT585_31440 [Ensifer sp. HO-A22]|uniref:Uncharacterized protein n=1 Tax=Ensifer oleiphilus TaxID=2742698 RepID=A0A7Y6QD00_9HYPH|nr:hypothetical protein [Ensifer oleiphilus]NVD43378.1 hypothetical protein [Ensifer oleiphilus]
MKGLDEHPPWRGVHRQAYRLSVCEGSSPKGWTQRPLEDHACNGDCHRGRSGPPSQLQQGWRGEFFHQGVPADHHHHRHHDRHGDAPVDDGAPKRRGDCIDRDRDFVRLEIVAYLRSIGRFVDVT